MVVWPRRVLVGVLVLAALGVIWLPVGATASPEFEAEFVRLAGRERSAAGLPAYAERADLADVARRWARRMAAEGRLYHNPRLGDEVDNWQAVGENVGRGPSVDDIHRAFMDSADHRREILSTDFTEVGVGVAIAADGEIWVAEVFRQPMAAAAKPAPAPAAAPAPAPAAVAPRPAPRAARAVAPRPEAAPATPAAPAAAPAPPVESPPTTIIPFDTSTVEGAFDARPVVRGRSASERGGAPFASVGLDRSVSVPVRIAATLLVLVVAGQLAFVMQASGAALGLRRRSPRRLAATAATLP